MTVITDVRCTAYHQLGHPERPARISRTVELLNEQSAIPIDWLEPVAPTDAQLRRAHSSNHLARLTVPMDFDSDTPGHPGIRAHAERSVGGALLAYRTALEGRAAFSLLRPPGHHATVDQAMGFCYLNSMAIAVLDALAREVGPVAVFDFDVHHCNGTEDILVGKENCAIFSVHQHPAYPGTGGESFRNAYNFPVPPGASRGEYRQALTHALEGVKRFAPKLLAVSAGFDAYRNDPLSDTALEQEDFHWLGEAVRLLGVPAFSILEGGYSKDLPDLIFAYLAGLTDV